MLLLTTTDKIQLISSSTAPLHVYVAFVDSGSPPTPGSPQLTAINTATTTDILAAPGSGIRNAKTINIRNTDASAANTVTVQLDRSATDYELFKATLQAGEVLTYTEGIGWYVLRTASRLAKIVRVTSDVVNATTSFADITGLSVAVESGKFYAFQAQLSHITNATTTGARFGANGPTASAFWISEVSGQTPGIAATNIAMGVATAYDTAIAASTTGPGATRAQALLAGYLNPSAAGTFVLRCASEVAVASGLTVQAGSWLRVLELDN